MEWNGRNEINKWNKIYKNGMESNEMRWLVYKVYIKRELDIQTR